MDNTNLSYKELESLFKAFERLPELPVAFVVKPSIFQQLKTNSEFREYNKLPDLLPAIYVDFQQVEDVIGFFDRLHLICYLNRLECPEAFAQLSVTKDRKKADEIIGKFLKEQKG